MVIEDVPGKIAEPAGQRQRCNTSRWNTWSADKYARKVLDLGIKWRA